MKVNMLGLIDLQKGFAIDGLTVEQGGSLYVPEGEKVGAPAAELIKEMQRGIIILSQDWHPANHVSFASNHEGKAPYTDVVNLGNKDGRYIVVDDSFGGKIVPQQMWTVHCVAGTYSAAFVSEIMDVLPHTLKELMADPTKNDRQHLVSTDKRRNDLYVIRKGMRSDLDSYGIGTENDGISQTTAPSLFKGMAASLAARGVKEADLYFGGLATNFCVEFSGGDFAKLLRPALEEKGIKTEIYFVPEISRGVPIEIPDGSHPDLAATPKRLEKMGIKTMPLQEALSRIKASQLAL